MTSDPKRRRSAAYRKGFQDATARAIELVDRCLSKCKGDHDPAELSARLREMSPEESQ